MTRFYRSTKDKKLAGICGALGEIYKIDANLLRIVTAVLALMTGFFPIVLLYGVAWLLLPEDLTLHEAPPMQQHKEHAV